MRNLHQNPPAVKAPISDAEWAAYRASRNARQPSAPSFAIGDRVLYHTPRSSRGGGRNIRGVVVKINPKSVTIEYAMLNRMTQQVVGYKRQSVNPMRLARVIEPVADDVNWHGGKKAVEVSTEEMPWDVLLDEIENKPGLWFDEPMDNDGDELAFMGATLDTLRLGLVEPVVRLTAAQMDEIERERPGEHFSRNGFMY